MEAIKKDLSFISGEEYPLPERKRAELFDGEEVAMSFPTTTHQSIIGSLFTEIAVHLREKKERAKVFAAPFAVFLKDDGRNYLEPDIAVVCDEKKLDDEGCHGAPDWVIEVVSPVSRKLDYGRKLGAYIDAGVREYWIVDAEKKVIVVYYLEEPDIPVIHHFGDIVKSGIYEDLMIDSAILGDISYRKAAVRVRDKEREDVISSLILAVKRALADEKRYGDIPIEVVDGVLMQEWKAAKEQLETCPAEREDLKAEYQKRCDVIEEFAPRMMTSAEEVKGYIESNFPEAAQSKNKGQIMKAVLPALKGKAEGKLINEAVAEMCR